MRSMVIAYWCASILNVTSVCVCSVLCCQCVVSSLSTAFCVDLMSGIDWQRECTEWIRPASLNMFDRFGVVQASQRVWSRGMFESDVSERVWACPSETRGRLTSCFNAARRGSAHVRVNRWHHHHRVTILYTWVVAERERGRDIQSVRQFRYRVVVMQWRW